MGGWQAWTEFYDPQWSYLAPLSYSMPQLYRALSRSSVISGSNTNTKWFDSTLHQGCCFRGCGVVFCIVDPAVIPVWDMYRVVSTVQYSVSFIHYIYAPTRLVVQSWVVPDTHHCMGVNSPCPSPGPNLHTFTINNTIHYFANFLRVQATRSEFHDNQNNKLLSSVPFTTFIPTPPIHTLKLSMFS